MLVKLKYIDGETIIKVATKVTYKIVDGNIYIFGELGGIKSISIYEDGHLIDHIDKEDL